MPGLERVYDSSFRFAAEVLETRLLDARSRALLEKVWRTGYPSPHRGETHTGEHGGSPFHVLDLFKGASGLREGFRLASERFSVVQAVELDVHAAATYQLNHGDVVHRGDIEEWLDRTRLPRLTSFRVGLRAQVPQPCITDDLASLGAVSYRTVGKQYVACRNAAGRVVASIHPDYIEFPEKFVPAELRGKSTWGACSPPSGTPLMPLRVSGAATSAAPSASWNCP